MPENRDSAPEDLLDVWVDDRHGLRKVGTLERFRDPGFVWQAHTAFYYDSGLADRDAVSITMPIRRAPYVPPAAGLVGNLPPIFDQSLPEGVLRDHLIARYAKLIEHMGDFDLAAITGASAIGRVLTVPYGQRPHREGGDPASLEHILRHPDSAALMEEMSIAGTPEDERRLLARLTRLAAEVEQSVTRTAYRFGAAAAYYRLVQQRVDDLREQRLAGFPPIREFMERRLAPAMATCQSVAARQTDLSTRIARKSALLRTRVDIELERQNQELLTQMNRRASLQLRLQETVEGLSVVAITYYGSQLVQYLAKGLQKSFAPALSPEIAAAVSIPAIAVVVALGIRRMRKALAAEADGH